MYECPPYGAMADLVATHGHDLNVFHMPPFGHGGRTMPIAGSLRKGVGQLKPPRGSAPDYGAAGARMKKAEGGGWSRNSLTRFDRNSRGRSSRCPRCILASHEGWT